MTMPAILPDWIPWWAQLALLVLALLFAVAFLLMPFAVFGLKGRLDLLEAQLDDMHADLRVLAMRLPDAEPGRPERRVMVEPEEYDAAPASRGTQVRNRSHPLRADDRRPRGDDSVARSDDRPVVRDGAREHDRSEPRLRWPPAPDRR
jgi:hypothetical protein